MSQLETPVALIIFNQPEATRRVFARIAAARPTRLFVIADAPRANRPGEKERCEETKSVVAGVDWPCQVEQNNAVENMGPGPRIISGISWVFSQVEEAIILEHDCLPDASFFPYCAQLLERYRHKSQVGFITGMNPLEKDFNFPFSYYFSEVGNFWGWATWRRVWQQYDERLSTWPEVKKTGLLNLIFKKRRTASYWSRIFDMMHAGKGPSTWDYQLAYTCWTQNFLGIVPSRNLVEYIGFGPQAENTTLIDPDLAIPANAMSFPLKHPPAITPWPAQAAGMQDRFFSQSLFHRIRRKLIMKSRAAKQRLEGGRSGKGETNNGV